MNYGVIELKHDAEKYPGCRVIGKLDRAYKADSVVTIGFKDQSVLYNFAKNNNEVDISLNYRLNMFRLGTENDFQGVVQYLGPYHPDIMFEMNPAYLDEAHEQDSFVAQMNMHIFPVEYKSDFNEDDIMSYQYSFVKNYKPALLADHKIPSIEIELQFLPLRKVYYMKRVSVWNTVLRTLAKLGGILGVIEVISYLIK